MSEVRTVRLDNGLTVLIEPLQRPAAAAVLRLPRGTASDPTGGEGAVKLLDTYLQRGAGERDTRELAEAFESLGARRGIGSSSDGTALSLTCLAEDWSEAMGLIADVALRPKLPADQLDPVRQLALQELRGLDDQPNQRLRVELLQRYFPGAYGRSRYGSEASLASLTSDGLRGLWSQLYRPEGAVLGIAGGVDPERVIDRVGELFGEWSGAAPAQAEPEPATSSQYDHVTLETEQVYLGVMYADVPPADPAAYHAAMAASVLSGGMGARLFTEVREKRGLCYAVGARRGTEAGCGYVVASAGTTTERSSETLEVLVGELRRLPGTVEQDEVDRARVKLLSQVVMADESTSARAARAVADQVVHGRVRAFAEIRAGIEAVTAASLNDHLAAWTPANFTVVTVGPSFTLPAGLEL